MACTANPLCSPNSRSGPEGEGGSALLEAQRNPRAGHAEGTAPFPTRDFFLKSSGDRGPRCLRSAVGIQILLGVDGTEAP